MIEPPTNAIGWAAVVECQPGLQTFPNACGFQIVVEEGCKVDWPATPLPLPHGK